MNINVTNTPDLLTIALAGRLDTATSPDFDNQVAQYLTPANVKDIVIDCSELEYICLLYTSDAADDNVRG